MIKKPYLCLGGRRKVLWGPGTRAPRAVRGHPIQTDLTPNPNAPPGDLELGCVLGRCVRDFDVGVKPQILLADKPVEAEQ